MIILREEKCYKVICELDGTSRMKEYICKEQLSQETYLLVKISESTLAKRFTLFLEEKISGTKFPDYRECFQSGGAFYAIFTYNLNPTLADKLSVEECSRNERSEIARRLLEQMLVKSPHPYFMRNALRPDMITVDGSLDVGWNYHLEEMFTFDYCTMETVCLQLSEVMEYLFQEELSKKLYASLEEYLLSLADGEMSDYLELYQKFLPVYEELCEEDQEERLPRTYPFRLWEGCKKLYGILKKVLAIAILAAALLYVVYYFRDTSGSRVVQQSITQIGDITIK